ncbi:MAG: CinA family nicotinamide mononucleotide deamidase-related protein [Thermoguttaceae bacterium]
MNAEILAIGDEITGGQLLDTNSQWLSQRLEEFGIRVHYHATVGDELDRCVAAFRQAIDRSDLVLITGGLGPTADDLTREALARATGRPLLLAPEALEHIRRLFVHRKREMPKQNELQAYFPQGSRVIANPHGTAPGIDLEVPRSGRQPSRVFALPGVPAEMVEMWHGALAAAVRQLASGGRVVCRRNINCFGAGESRIEALLPDLIRRGRSPRVGINASKATIILRITAEGASQSECQALIEPTVATIHRCLGTLVFGEGDDQLQDVVLLLLAQRPDPKTLATAEIGTAGLLADWLGSAADPGDCYRGGLVLRGHETAETLAQRCRGQFQSDYGLAVGPFPSRPAEERAVEPPLVAFALATPTAVRVKQIPFAGHPALLRTYCGKVALDMLRLELLEGA